MADDINTYRQALEDMLEDRGNESWTEEEIDAAIRLALMDVSRRLPRSLSVNVTLDEDGRQVPTDSLADCLWIEEVWWPYEEGEYPPRLVPFEVREGEIFLYTEAVPVAGDVVHVLYAGGHVISGLDGAVETTVPGEWRGVLTLGAAGYAALAKASAMAREYVWPSGAADSMRDWGEIMLALFQARLKAMRPAAVQAWVTW